MLAEYVGVAVSGLGVGEGRMVGVGDGGTDVAVGGGEVGVNVGEG